MITIRELLNRIRWDPEFSRGEFTIGYFDRLEGGSLRSRLARRSLNRMITFPSG